MDFEYMAISLLLAVGMIIVAASFVMMLPVAGKPEANAIKRKAQSFVFPIAIMLLIYESVKEFYAIFKGIPYERQSVFAFLGSISILYLISFLYLKIKHRNQQIEES